MADRTIALVACGKAKLDRAAPARDLYIGNLFRAARAHVEAASYDTWYILSAKHHLVHPDTVIAPYDYRLPKRASVREAWARAVDCDLRDPRLGNLGTFMQQRRRVELGLPETPGYPKTPDTMANGGPNTP